MAEVKPEEEQELREPELDNSEVGEVKEDPDCTGDQSPTEAGPSLVLIKEELEEQKIPQKSVQAFPVIVCVRSEKEESVLWETVKEEDTEDTDGAEEERSENSSDTDDSGDWTHSAESPTPQTHTDQQQRPFNCSVCPRNFTRKYYLHLHMRSHQTERPFRCPVCTKDFTRQCYLQIHLKTHRLSTVHQTVTEGNREAGAGLEEQSENFFDREVYCAESPTPQSQTDQRQQPFSCSFCPRNFTRKYYLHLHMKSHQTERPFNCSVCSKHFTRKRYLQLHLKTHREQTLYQTKHEDQNNGDKNKVMKSTLDQTVTEENNEDEAGLEEQSENSFDRKVCSPESPTAQSQSDQQQRQFSCSFCPRNFTRKYYLHLHMKSHQTERPFNCLVCSKHFTRKCYLQLHLKTHREQTLYQTKHEDQDNGGKNKVMKSTLHQTVTEENNEDKAGLEEQSENSFDREDCSAESPTTQSHTDQRQRPFSCLFCPRNFTRKYYLHLHMKSHQTERPFNCLVCSKHFTRKCYLQIHLKTHREQTLYQTKHEDQDNGGKNKVMKSTLHQTVTEENNDDKAGLEEQSENSFDREVCSAESPATQSHTDQRQRQFSCSFCPRNFTRKYYLHLHMRSHPKERLFKCSVCTKDFTRKCHLQIHLKTHSGQRQYQTKHTDQDKEGKNKKVKKSIFLQTVTEETREDGAGLEKQSENSSAHEDSSAKNQTLQKCTKVKIKSEATGQTIQCSTCGKGFQTIKRLRSHELIHIEEKPCHLQLRMRTHQTERPYSCPVCAKTFTQKCYLQLHLKSHRGQRRYQTNHKDRSKGRENKKRQTSLHQTIKEENSEDRDGAGSDQHSVNYPDTDDSGDWNPLKCHQCGKGFPSIKTLNRHEKNHLEEKPYKCLFCKRSYLSNAQREDHMRTHTGEKPFRCSFCTKQFALVRNLNLHMRIHTGVRPFRCQICLRTYTQRQSLKMHMLTHLEEKPFRCTVCEKGFTEKKTLKLHMRIHTGEKPHKCSICAKTFTLNGHLNRHMLTHSDERPFKCSVCDHGFKEKKSLKIHMKIHADERSYKCDICARSFNQYCTLTQHMRGHTGPSFSCSLCSKRYVRKSHLKKHMQTHNGNFKCSICEKCFAEKEKLEFHMNARHTGERPFQCTICIKDFASEGWFQKHMRIHDREKSLRCAVCSRIFKNKFRLDRHVAKHTNEGPFSCSICSKELRSKSSLYIHTRGHDFDKTFACGVCAQRFPAKSDLKTHLGSHTGDCSVRLHKLETETLTPTCSSPKGNHIHI